MGIRENCEVESWNRFITRALAVTPDVLGFTHNFNYRDYQIEIKLPSISDVRERFEHSAMATNGSRRSTNNELLEYRVHQVDVIVNKGQSLLIDPETLNRNPVAYELYNKTEQDEFERICIEYELVARESFEYWLSVLRWVLDDFRIGRQEILGNDSGWSTHLNNRKKSRTVYGYRREYSPLKGIEL